MLLRPFVVSLSAFALTVLPSLAQTASPPSAANAAAAAPQTISPAEIAYWKQLQSELSDLRTANLKLRLKTAPYEASAEDLSALATRLEKFLDQRDKDPVADLGDDLKAYRERLIKLIELALEPVTASAKFKSTFVTNGEARMLETFKIYKLVGAVDEYKPKLALLHEAINVRVTAAGGGPRFFFQTIGIGDKPAAAGSLGSPEERDAQFVKDSEAIGPVFADLAKGNFVANRIAHGLTDGLMDPVIQTVEKFRDQFADVPTDQLTEALKTAASMQEEPGQFNLKRHVLRLDLMRRDDNAAYTIAMQEFQGAFLRWLGKADAIAPLGLCADVAVAHDGSWFAHAPSDHSILVRESATGKVRATIATPGAVRALAASTGDDLLFFTTDGLHTVDVSSANPQPELRSALKTVFVQPRIAASREDSYFAFALGIKPGVNQGTVQQTFSVEKSASRVTAVGINADGRTVAYGFAGDNVTGSGDPRHGYDVLQFADDSAHLADSKATTTSRQISSPITGATIALSMSADGKKIAASTLGASAGVVYYDDLTTEKMDRKVLTVDPEAYSWVQLIEGTPTRVAAGSRSGNVRVWDVSTRELVATFSVPAGPGGAAYAAIGDEVVSVAIGQPGIHRWKLADGAWVASLEGEVVPADAASRAARLTQERTFTAARESLIAAIDAENDAARLPLIEKMRGPQAKLVEGLGMTAMVDNWFAGIRINQMQELGKAKRPLEAFELGNKEISTGVLQPYLVYMTLFAGNRVYGKDATPEFRQRVLAIGERAIALYPTEVTIHSEYRRARVDAFQAQGKIAEAIKEVDELDIVDPTKAPHARERYDIQMYAYDFADKAGRKRDAMNALIAAMDYATKPADRLMLANNIFYISYTIQDWKLAVNAANMVLQMDEKMKDDQKFMASARYAYQMANPK